MLFIYIFFFFRINLNQFLSPFFEYYPYRRIIFKFIFTIVTDKIKIILNFNPTPSYNPEQQYKVIGSLRPPKKLFTKKME